MLAKKLLKWTAAALTALPLLSMPALAAPTIADYIPATPLRDYETVETGWLTYPADGSVVVTRTATGGYKNSSAMKISFSPLQNPEGVWSSASLAQEAYQSTWASIASFEKGMVFYVKNPTESPFYFKLQADILPAGGQLPSFRVTAAGLRFYNEDGSHSEVADSGEGLYTIPAGFAGWMMVPSSSNFILWNKIEHPNWRVDEGQDSALNQITGSGSITGPDTLHLASLILTTGHGGDSGQAVLILDHLFSYSEKMPDFPDKPGNTGDVASVAYAVSAISALGGLFLLQNARKNKQR